MKFYHTKTQINLRFNGLQVVKIFVDHLTFALLLYLISGLLSGLLDELCLKMSTGELNNDFHQEQIQAPPKLAEKDTRLLASTDEDKFSTTNNSGEIIENILPLFSATNSLVCISDLRI